MAVETEIKLPFPRGAESARELLSERGFHQTNPRHLEIDQVFDHPGGELRTSGRLLRLRSADARWVVTYKGPPSPGRHKSREEIETEVSDGDALTAILDRLGYRLAFRYEKYRTKFSEPTPAGGIATIDETPIGVFLELEGAANWIDKTAARLGFAPSDYVVDSYATLYADYLREHPEAPSNMTFVGP